MRFQNFNAEERALLRASLRARRVNASRHLTPFHQKHSPGRHQQATSEVAKLEALIAEIDATEGN